MDIITVNIIGIIIVAILLITATIVYFWEPKPKKKPINCIGNYKYIYETDTETVFVEDDGTEIHLKKEE